MVEVAYLHEFSTLNGGEHSFLNLLRHLDRCRFQPVVLGPEVGELAPEVRKLGVEFLDFNMRKEGKRGSFEEVASSVAALLRERSTSIVHSNSLSTGEYSGLIASKLAGQPVAISHVRDIQKLKRSRVQRLELNDAIIPVSHATSLHLIAQGVEPELLHVIHNGIDPWENIPPAQDLWPGDDGSQMLVACIGQICLRKAQDLALEAMLEVLAAEPSVHFAIVGERFSQKDESLHFENSLHELARTAGFEDRVHFLGYRRDVANILCRAKLLIHAAHQEPLGRVLLEAQSMGVPVVCTEVGGSAEIIQNGESGLLVPAGDAKKLAEGLLRLFSEVDLYDHMQLEGPLRTAKLFDSKRSSEQVMALYDRLLESA